MITEGNFPGAVLEGCALAFGEQNKNRCVVAAGMVSTVTPLFMKIRGRAKLSKRYTSDLKMNSVFGNPAPKVPGDSSLKGEARKAPLGRRGAKKPEFYPRSL